jgi:hypothetical protein
VNYYMLMGGNNYGTIAGASVTTAYAQDAPVCPDLVLHEPVFSHLSRLHQALARSAGTLLAHPAQLDHGKQLGYPELTAFDYGELTFLKRRRRGAHRKLGWRRSRLHRARYCWLRHCTQNVRLTGRLDWRDARHRIITPVAAGLRWDAWAEPLLHNERGAFQRWCVLLRPNLYR